MSDWTELKRLAEVRKSAGWKTMDSVELETILALIAENERLRADGNDVFGLAQARADTIEQLRAEVEALRKDAERYRWLRGHHGLSLKGHDFISYGEVADFRIDNAMTVVKADG